MKYGLTEEIIESIQHVFEAFPPVDKAILYGSRAKGNYKPGSDIDLTLKGTGLNLTLINQVSICLDDLYLPYTFDLSIYTQIENRELLEHIDRVGVEFYSRWIDKALKNAGCSLLSGYAFKSSDYSKEGIPLIKIGNIQNKTVTIDCNGDFVQDNIVNGNVSKYLLSNADVLIAMTGQGSVGRVGRLKLKQGDKALLNQRVGKFICDEINLNIDYLFYVLTSNKYQDLLFNTGSGSGQPNLSPELILETIIPWVKYSEQIAIASILSSLDDKIDLLQRQNKTLEHLAETLFRQWFVEEAEESWEVGKLEDVISVIGGTTPSTKKPEFWDGNINWTSPRDLSNATSVFLFTTERKISEAGLAQIGSGLLPVGTVLLSSRAPIGYLTITEIPVAINQGYIAIVCDKIVSNYFIFLWCRANMETIENAGNGSVFQEISKSSFKGLEIIIPSVEKLGRFDKIVSLLFQKIKSNQIQIRTLTQTRDTLLPKLMSGEVRVKLSELG